MSAEGDTAPEFVPAKRNNRVPSTGGQILVTLAVKFAVVGLTSGGFRHRFFAIIEPVRELVCLAVLALCQLLCQLHSLRLVVLLSLGLYPY